MVIYACEQCGKEFDRKQNYDRHQNRKNACAPILETPGEGQYSCQFCRRGFATKRSLATHIRKNCKIAGSEEGMELLFEHTLKKQEEAKQLAAQAAEIEALKAQVAALKAPQRHGDIIANANTVGANVGTNNGVIDQSTKYILNFNQAPLKLTCDQILAALRDSPGFSQYATMGDPERFHKDNRSIVHESIMDLTRISHEDPVARNVYLSPNRADQAMILTSSDVDTRQWEVLPLDDAVKQMIGGLSKELRKVGHDHRIHIDIDDRGALCGLGFITQVEDDRLAHELRKPMSAHLENQRWVSRKVAEPDTCERDEARGTVAHGITPLQDASPAGHVRPTTTGDARLTDVELLLMAAEEEPAMPY
jgi:hypothetical protein